VVVNPFQLPPRRFSDLRQGEVLLNRQTRDDAAVFGDQLNPGTAGLKTSLVVHAFTLQIDLATLELGLFCARYALQRRSLTRAVASQQREDLLLLQRKRHVLHDVGFAIVAADVTDLQIRLMRVHGFWFFPPGVEPVI